MRVSADVVAELWSKLMVNCAYNAISGLAQAPYGAARGRAVESASCSVRWCARWWRSRRPKAWTCRCDASLEAMERIAVAMPGQLSSTAQDMARRKPQRDRSPERLRRAPRRELGVATPVNQTLHALVKLVEAARARLDGAGTATATSPMPPSRFRRIRAGACASSAWPTPDAAHRRAARRRRVVGHLAHRHRARPGMRQARAAASCAWPPTGRRRSSATPTRRAGCSVANEARARLRAAGARPASRSSACWS